MPQRSPGMTLTTDSQDNAEQSGEVDSSARGILAHGRAFERLLPLIAVLARSCANRRCRVLEQVDKGAISVWHPRAAFRKESGQSGQAMTGSRTAVDIWRETIRIRQ
jgi:hypothetical protein